MTTFPFILLILFKICKCENGTMEPFVVGGDYTNIVTNPHAVFLTVNARMEWICGGSVLNQKIILTAAHCLEDCKLKNSRHTVDVFAGHENLNKVKIRRKVEQILIHRGYQKRQLEDDIALGLLNKNLPLGRNVKRVIIPTSFPKDLSRVTVTGWGTVDLDTGATSKVLKYTTQRLRSKATCAILGDMSAGAFCAGSTEPDSDHASLGDSGGALVASKVKQIGLVSFSSIRYPALVVYTNVTYYSPWIQENSKRLYCGKDK